MLDAATRLHRAQGRPDEARRCSPRRSTGTRDDDRELRDLSFSLEPVVLRDHGFGPAVARARRRRAGWSTGSRSRSTSPAREALGERTQVALYQIVREALEGAIRRGPPTTFGVRVVEPGRRPLARRAARRRAQRAAPALDRGARGACAHARRHARGRARRERDGHDAGPARLRDRRLEAEFEAACRAGPRPAPRHVGINRLGFAADGRGTPSLCVEAVGLRARSSGRARRPRSAARSSSRAASCTSRRSRPRRSPATSAPARTSRRKSFRPARPLRLSRRALTRRRRTRPPRGRARAPGRGRSRSRRSRLRPRRRRPPRARRADGRPRRARARRRRRAGRRSCA